MSRCIRTTPDRTEQVRETLSYIQDAETLA